MFASERLPVKTAFSCGGGGGLLTKTGGFLITVMASLLPNSADDDEGKTGFATWWAGLGLASDFTRVKEDDDFVDLVLFSGT